MARRRGGKYVFTAKRRAALRRAARKPRKHQKSSDTIGYYVKQLPGMAVNAVTMGKGTKVFSMVEHKGAQHRRRYKRYKRV